MEPVRLEILLDDKTLKGMLSVEGNLNDICLLYTSDAADD
mgnify:CR=1 FL=1